jgi:hypothetical protein
MGQEYLRFDANLRLAMRARSQSQARATAETLAQLKNRSQVIARQANVNGNVPVNNGVQHKYARARVRFKTAQN